MNASIEVVGWTLIHFVWQGTAIALVVAAALRVTQWRSPNVRYLIACAGLAAMLAAPAATARLLWTESRDAAIAGSGDLNADLSSARSADGGLSSANGRDIRAGESAARAKSRRFAATDGWSARLQPGALEGRQLDRVLRAVTLAWLAGVVLLLARMGGGWWYVRRLHHHALATPSSRWQTSCRRIAYRLGLPAAAHVVESSRVDVPTVVGWLRPAILLPIAAIATLTPAQVEAILAHELAHIRRHDYVINLLQTVAETLLFYHPAVWWLSKRIRAEREHCCDEVAVSLCGDAVGYAKALAKLEAWRTASTPFAVAATGGSLIDRVRRILRIPIADEPRSPSWAATLALTIVFTAGAGVVQHFPWSSSGADARAAAVLGGMSGDYERLAQPPQPPEPPEPPQPAQPPQPSQPPLPPPEPPAPPAPPDSIDIDVPMPPMPPMPPLAPMPPLPPMPPLVHAQPVPPAPPAPPTPPAPPAPPAADGFHFRVESGEQRLRMSWNDGTSRLEVTLDGDVTFTDDLSDVRTLSDGGRLTIRDWATLIPRTIEIRSSGGTLTHRYYVAGIERPWDDEARQKLAEQITALVRHSGLGAESRVRSIFEKKGVGGVLDEIDLLGGDYARRRYFVALIDTARLDATTVLPVLLRVGSTMNSDYDRGQVLQRIASNVRLDQRAAQAYVQALSKTKSDYERRRALTALLAVRPVVAGVPDIALRSVADMRSDYDRSEVLRTALASGTVEQADALFAAVGRMSSSYEKRRVLTEVIARGSLNNEMKKGVLTAAAGIQSDYDRAQVLSAYVKAFGVETSVRDEFFTALKRLTSDYERRRVLTELAAKGGVSREVQESAFESVLTMRSDYDRAEVLLAFLGAKAVDASNRQAFVTAAERIRSTHDQNRVLAALVRSERR